MARLDGAQVRHVQVLDLAPLGYPSGDLNHLVAKRCGELGSQVSPDDDLDVARLILIPLIIHIDRGQHVGTGARADKLPEMVVGETTRVPLVP